MVVKIKKKNVIYFHFDPAARVFAIEHKIQLCDNLYSALFICLTPFSQGCLGLIGCMILMEEFVSLTTVAMEIGKKNFQMVNEKCIKRKNT